MWLTLFCSYCGGCCCSSTKCLLTCIECVLSETRLLELPTLICSIACRKLHPMEAPQSQHPARFSPDDKFSRERMVTKRRFNLLPTQKPPHEYWLEGKGSARVADAYSTCKDLSRIKSWVLLPLDILTRSQHFSETFFSSFVYYDAVESSVVCCEADICLLHGPWVM